MAYDNTNRGTLGRNKKKQEPNHADYTGQCNIEGQEFWINGWVQENKKTGEKFFSLSFKEKQARQGGGQRSQPITQEDDGEVPF